MNAMTTMAAKRELGRRAPHALPMLSDLEWQVVALAMRNAGETGVRSGSGMLGRLWTALTGIEPKRPLADPRLETLRRFASTVRAKGAEAATLAGRLIELGFTQRQIAAVALLARG